MKTFVRQRGHLLAHQKVLALDTAEKNISCFSKKKRERLIKRILFFGKVYQKNTIFSVFFFFGVFFFVQKKKLKKRNKTADETCEN